ncbi:putative nuclease HARBI1 [Ixodes scapularis]|uniref:putative nuclease HARBI1 n=1 Tax=Ixodes scapularis TaxID=6945 RepID=UPI001A9EF6A8|nr:putative nuclease HARBI1 [Ixodes scapularis]
MAAYELLYLWFRRRRRFFTHVDAFVMDDDEFRRHYRLSKNIVRWLCDELRDDAALRRQRRARTVMTVEQQVLCALRFYATGSYQGQVASDRHLAVHQTTVSACVRAVSTAIVRRLGPRWIAFPETAEERAATQKAFLRRGSLPGVVGCVDGTFVAIKGPSKYDPTVTKALYWCRKQYYALNVMVVSDADLRILAIDPRMPGSTHDSYVWRRSWVRQECVAGHLVRHNEYLLGESGYPLEPWLMTPVPGRPALGTPTGEYNQAHASMRAVVERCIGLLKSRFRCLHRHRTLYHHPKIAGTIVAACAVLHNVCLCSGEAEPEPQSDSDSSSDEDSDEEESADAARERRGLQSRRLYSQGKAVRDRLVLLPSTTHLQRVRERLRRTRRRRQHQ